MGPKFNAWDTKRKKMWLAEEMGRDQLTLSPDGRGFVNVHGTSTRLSRYLPHLIPLHFTGLTDKTGKDDYVGNVWEVEYRGKKHRFLRKRRITWQGYEFEFKCLTGNISPVHANIDEDGIIIGNQFENPKLLET